MCPNYDTRLSSHDLPSVGSNPLDAGGKHLNVCYVRLITDLDCKHKTWAGHETWPLDTGLELLTQDLTWARNIELSTQDLASQHKIGAVSCNSPSGKAHKH